MPSTTPTNRVKDPSEISKRIKEQATAAESVSEEDGKAGKEQVIVVEMGELCHSLTVEAAYCVPFLVERWWYSGFARKRPRPIDAQAKPSRWLC